ncbi:MAG: hypothetical protein IJ381_03250 [Clostridia bacterium]|nr:hypothetical protein [Clostridia bacterium]
MVYIAIDIGSTYIKSSLLDPKTGEIAERNRAAVSHKLQLSSPLRFEIDMGQIFASVKAILDTYTRARSDIAGILLSTQQHGFVYCDPAYPGDTYISWQDARCLEPIDESGETVLSMLQKMIPVEEMKPTGVYLKPALGMCNLYALIRERGGVITPGAKLYSLGSYLIEKLTGSNVCHITNAAPIGLADIFNGCWYQPLIEKLGFAGIELPKLAMDLSICGYYEADGQRIAVYPDTGDVQTCIHGGGALEGDVAVNMATAGQVCMVHKASSIGRGDPRYYEIRPHFDGLYCHTISRMPSGRNMEVLVDLIAEIGEKIYGQKATSAEIWKKLGETGSAQSTQGLSVDVSFYETPEQLADGGISHIDRANLTLENLFGAAYADLGRKYAYYIRMMEEAVGQKATRMVFCGGAVRNNPMIRRALENEVGLEGLLFGSGDEVHEGMMRLAKSIEKAKETKGE